MGSSASCLDSSNRRRRSIRHHQSCHLLKRDPAQQQQLQMRSLAGILLLVVSLSTFGVTSTFQSVLLTDTTGSIQQRQLEDRHPFSGRRRKLRNDYQQRVSTTTSSTNSIEEQQPSQQQQQWHVLSFGSASTWGSGLATSQQPYPSLLGDANALSIALPTGHVYADLAAACAQTMVVGSDDESDHETTTPNDINLVTVEYYEFSESHRILIQRMRQRYPAAAIVLVRLLQPATQLVLSKDSEESTIAPTTFAEWNAQREERDPPSSDDALEEILLRLVEAMMQADSTWGLARATAETDARITAMLHSDSLLLHQQLPVPFEFRAAKDLHDVLRLYNYQGDATVLSAAGHAAVAEAIQSLLQSSVPTTLLHNLRSNVVANGNWGSGDDCHVWYTTGNYNLESTGRRVNLPVIPQQQHHHEREGDTTILSLAASSAGMIAGTHKHALEFDRHATPSSTSTTATAIFGSATGANKITVHNPFDHDRMLSLTYLTDADSMSYPRTRVVVNGAPTVLLQPFHDHVTTNTRHVARTSGVGFIPPGASVVALEPLQSTKLPFRLLGASLLAEEVQNLPSIEFALEPDSLEAEADDDAVVGEAPVVSTSTSATSSGSSNAVPKNTASSGLLSSFLLR